MMTDDMMRERARLKSAYEGLWASPQAQAVLEDLAHFCCANKPTFEPNDPHGRVSAFREGRREVYLRILKMSTPSPQEHPND